MRAILATALIATVGCGSGSKSGSSERSAPVPAASAQTRFDGAVATFYWAHMAARPVRAMRLGFHQHDGKLPDVSPAALAAEIARLQRAEKIFSSHHSIELDPMRRAEREVLLAEIRKSLFDLDVARMPWRNPIAYVRGLALTAYVSRDYAPLAERAEGLIRLASGVGAFLAQAQANLPERIPRPWLQIALLQTNGMISFAKTDVLPQMKGLEAQMRARVEKALASYNAALGSFRDFLKQRMARATDDYALGRELFLRMLRDKEGLAISLERLTEIGKRDLARNLAAIKQAAAELAPKLDTRAAIAQALSDKPEAAQVLDVARAQSKAMRQLLIDKKIVSIPSAHVAEVRESPAFMRWNSAFLDGAGPFEKKPLPSFYYISPPDPSWTPEVQRAYIPARDDLLFTTIHELWPGHFLHGLHRKRNPSMVLKSFCTYSMSEGWAHYTEEMMRVAGAGGNTPSVRIGQLMNALLRNVRFLSAVGLHTGKMTVEQSAAMFRDQAFTDEGTAKQQSVRGTFDPGYLNYTLGKLMIMKLRADYEKKVGPGFSLQSFHDRFLSYGCAPVPVIRRLMLGPNAGPAL